VIKEFSIEISAISMRRSKKSEQIKSAVMPISKKDISKLLQGRLWEAIGTAM
jgi:hypothetical protein